MMSAVNLRALSLGCLAALSMACTASAPKISALDRLKPCIGDDGPADAYCGTYAVFENRATRQGRKINLRIVMQPALGNNPKPDALFFLAGGPGQAAGDLAKPLSDIFRSIQRERDIVYVDQRGTGKSNPLDCKMEEVAEDTLQDFSVEEGQKIAQEQLKKCLAKYDADASLYTTSIAMDDLDDVRAYLGYDKIDIYGGSYGTRAGLVYLRQHGDHVRAAVLDSVAPTNMRLPLFFARDAQRALDRLIADCAADEVCNAKYPNLAERTRALFARLEKSPPKVKITHPRTGNTAEVPIEASLIASIVHSMLYQPLVASLLPELLMRAEHDDFSGLIAVASSGGGAGGMAIGMQLSVLCAEDYPRIEPNEIEKESAGTVFAHHLLTMRLQACSFWPKGKVDPSYYEPVKSDVPTLVLSGEVDPVTPPVWGEAASKTLTKSRHVIVSEAGHGALNTGCGLRMIRDFIQAGTVDGLDTKCATTVTRPPFFVTPAGPDPTRSTTAKAADKAQVQP